MFSPDMIDLMVHKSNRYVEAVLVLELALNTHLREWKPTDVAEMQVFLALQISLGLLKKPKIVDYWRSVSVTDVDTNFQYKYKLWLVAVLFIYLFKKQKQIYTSNDI